MKRNKHSMRVRGVVLCTAAAAALAASVAVAAPGVTTTGPNTTTLPYMQPVGDGVSIKSLLTVGEGAGDDGYKMVGIPDGLGAYRSLNGSRDFKVLMNHELTGTAGAVRRHGQKGSFVSELDIDSSTAHVERGGDLIDGPIGFWDYLTQAYTPGVPSTGGVNPRDITDTFVAQAAAFSRFCSSSLTNPGLLWNKLTRKGYKGQIYFANEESGDEARTFGVTVDGEAQQLPRLGLGSWENTNAGATTDDTTVTIGTEDAATGQLRVYVGAKQKTGNAFDKAGLTNGAMYVVDLHNEAVSNDVQFRSTFGKATPAAFDLGASEVVDWDSSGARQNADAAAAGLSLNRIEDGAFDPSHRNDFYFLTTEGAPGVVPSEPAVTRDGGGLWRLRFADVNRPQLGGSLELLLDGSEAPYLNKPDNLTVSQGNVLIQEDPGNNAQLARIVAYRISTGQRGVLAEFNADQFRIGGANYITQDEESSGIIDARPFLGKGWYLFDAQVHKVNPDPALVEYGQLLAMEVPNWNKIYAGS